MSDNPNTAPFMPNTLALSSGLVKSAIIACATELFHPVIPSNTRERNITIIGNIANPNTSIFGERYAHASTSQLSIVPACVQTNIFFRPYLSERVPSIGADKN